MKPLNVSRETLPSLFVVEGKHDVERLIQVVDAPVLSTNGAAISDEFLQQLIQLERSYNIVLILDPDGPGERIRSIIAARLEFPNHVFIPVDEARSHNKLKVGVEHVSRETLKQLIGNVKTTRLTEALSTAQLYQLGLVGSDGASQRREFLCNRLSIGLANAKTLSSKLQMFGYAFDQISNVMESYE